MLKSHALLNAFALALALAAPTIAAHAAKPAPANAPDTTLSVPAGGGEMLPLPAPAVAVFVADPDVADVHVPTPQTVFVLGKKAGTTTLFALGSTGNFIGGLFNGRAAINATSNLFNLAPSGAFSILGGFHTSRYAIDGVLDALDQEGLITMLAEPNLTAMSGQTASFLAGGEFPIPVAQDTTGAITIEFKPYGVSLDFTPTVLANNRISLKVRPEVSEIDPTNSVTTGSVKVPALTVRRVETTVELASGQSFAIGGLLQSKTSDVLSQLPGLGRLPVLGKLFSSKDYLNNKSEVVVIVTPYIVQPAGAGQLRDALDSVTHPSSDIEFALQRSLGLDPLSGEAPRLVGAAGFVY